jgi:hypothetical protein
VLLLDHLITQLICLCLERGRMCLERGCELTHWETNVYRILIRGVQSLAESHHGHGMQCTSNAAICKEASCLQLSAKWTLRHGMVLSWSHSHHRTSVIKKNCAEIREVLLLESGFIHPSMVYLV